MRSVLLHWRMRSNKKWQPSPVLSRMLLQYSLLAGPLTNNQETLGRWQSLMGRLIANGYSLFGYYTNTQDYSTLCSGCCVAVAHDLSPGSVEILYPLGTKDDGDCWRCLTGTGPHFCVSSPHVRFDLSLLPPVQEAAAPQSAPPRSSSTDKRGPTRKCFTEWRILLSLFSEDASRSYLERGVYFTMT